MQQITETSSSGNSGGYFISEVTAIDVIEHLNSYLSDFARKNLELAREKRELQRRYDNLLRLFEGNKRARELAP